MDTTQAQALQPTAQAPDDPAYQRRDTQAACPVCGRPGWIFDLRTGGTVTLHSERSTADGQPIIDDACWARDDAAHPDEPEGECCPDCGGEGTVLSDRPGYVQRCPTCHGEGEVYP